MDQFHRNKLDQYCDILVPQINLKNLWPKLLENRVFNNDDVNVPRWMKNLNDLETTRDVFLTIKTRGPQAYGNLVLSLKQSGHEHLANILEDRGGQAYNNNQLIETSCIDIKLSKEKNVLNTKTLDQIVNEDKIINDDYYVNMQKASEPLMIKVIAAEQFLDGPVIGEIERYPMRSNPRGLVLIINNMDFLNERERLGAQHDENNLKELFEQMGFKVTAYRNLTGQEIYRKTREFSQLEELYKVHSCFVIVCTHGMQSEHDHHATEIKGTDANEVNYRKIYDIHLTDMFSSRNCLALMGKPKVFIFQTCRGRDVQYCVSRVSTDGFEKSYTLESSSSKVNNVKKECYLSTVRDYSDTLVAYSTLPGFVSYRDTFVGSWSIQVLCEVFMNYAHKHHLQDLFHLIDNRLQRFRAKGNQCQTLVTSFIGFNKHCYINPGLFEEQQ